MPSRLRFIPKSSGGGGFPFFTTFPVDESILDEGGKWLNGARDGIDWNDIEIAGGNAIATDFGIPAPPYDDCIACINPAYLTFNPNQYAEGTVYRRSSPTLYNSDHEIELHTRLLITPNSARGYEAYWNVAVPGVIDIYIVRWNGPLNGFDYLANNSIAGTGATGNVMRMETTGTNPVNIAVKVNGVTVVSFADGSPQRILTGQPGIGQNPYGVGSNFTDWAFSDFRADNL